MSQTQLSAAELLAENKNLQARLRELEAASQKQAAEIQQVDEKYRNLVDNELIGVYQTSLDGTVLFVNLELAHLLSFDSPDEMIGTKVSDYYKNPDDRARLLEALKNENKISNFEAELLTSNGHTITVLLSATLKGEVLFGMIRNISEQKRAEKVREVVYKISQAGVSASNLDELYQSIHALISELLSAENFYIALYDPASDLLSFPYAVDEYDEDSPPHKPGRGLTEYVLRSGKPLFASPEVFDQLVQQGEVELVGKNSLDWLGVPLKIEDRTIGVMVVQTYTDGVRFSQSDADLLEFTSTQVAQAIERKHTEVALQASEARYRSLFENAQARLHRIQGLRKIDMAITSSFDLGVTMDVILDQTLFLLNADAADILLLNPILFTLEFVSGRGFTTPALRYTRLRLGEGFAGQAALERQTLHISDLRKNTGSLLVSQYLGQEGFVSYFGVPLIAKGQVVGVLEIFHRTPFDPDQDWLDTLEALAGQAAIAIDNTSLFDNLQRSNTDLIQAYDSTLEGWAKALELRDRETEGHTRRVTEMTEILARAMGIPDSEIIHIRRGSLLHDIGKMGVPDEILFKPDTLNEQEWEVMRQHPEYSYNLLKPITYLKSAIEIPYCHHEKWDGSGYPRGLKGEDIPIAARIFSVVDVWDALTSDRPYRKAWSKEKAITYIQEESGIHFDPNVVNVFMEMYKKGEIFSLLNFAK